MNQQPSDALIHDALKHWHTSIVESGNDFDRMKSTLTAIMPQPMEATTKPVDVATAQALSSLKKAEMFIENGVELGFIRLPEKDDPALETLPIIKSAIRTLSAEPARGARPLEEWHEDHGNVVWWAWDNVRKEWFGEPAYIGKPFDSDWPEYHTHWTPHPAFPAAPTPEAEA